jgi:hypothetical protein
MIIDFIINKYIDKLFSGKFGYLMYFSYLIYSYDKQNIMEIKVCSKCKQEKSLDLFYNHLNGRKQSWCKQCLYKKTKEFWKTPEGIAYKKKYYSENKELYVKATKKWVKNNRKKANQFVYNWYEQHTKQYVGIQDKYQSKFPPSVYCIKYDDDIVYVGSSKKPLARVNIHLSTIKSGTNLTKINKLHSYCGYDKSRFTYEYLEQCDSNKLLERERFWEEKLNAKGNFKCVFGKVKSITQIMQDEGTYKYKK